ncbi:MAG: transcriptional repressor LexA [Candidatus Omnitrophota bacterium]
MEERQKLTPKQKKVLRFIYEEIKNSRLPPTIREIAEQFGFSSTGTVRDYLRALVSKGYIKISAGKSRAIELVKEALFQVPVVGSVAAGHPTLAVEDIEGYLDLDSLVYPEDDYFALRVKGDSMIDAGILPNDFVLIRRQQVAEVGEIVVALIDDEATVKTLAKRGDKFFLEPANARYKPIPVTRDTVIIGKVLNIIRKY